MKLVINYDLIDAIRNVNEPLTPFKVVRNRKNNFLTYLSILTLINFCQGSSVLETIEKLGMYFGTVISADILIAMSKSTTSVDFFADESSKNLKRLVGELEALNISTSYDLLLKSEIYDKKYKVEMNKEQLPHIAEKKYILVPSYTYNGDIKDTSVLQEHIVGSKQYVLSLGSLKKVFKPSYSSI